MFDIFDKWKYSDPVLDHGERFPLRRTLFTMQKTGRPIPVL